jgi:hypothetical protein
MKPEKIRTVKADGYNIKPITEIVFHNIPSNRKVCGVYKIMFGDKYYIGQSFHTAKRAKVHQSEINKLVNCDGTSGKRANIISHVKNNKEITSIHVFMLEECPESELLKTEQKWLTLSKKDSNCLNSNFISYANPSISIAKNFKPIPVNINLTFNTPREYKLYNTFLSELDQVKKNPRVNLKKWFS